MHYYQFNIADYRKDTGHLSILEHGVYRQLLDWYYLNEQPIPKETEVVFRRLSAKTKEEKDAVISVLSDFFVLRDGYSHIRCDHEITLYQGKADTARENGKLGGRPKKTKVVILANPDITNAKANQEPLTINHKPITKDQKHTHLAMLISLGIEDQIAKDWLAIRKAKRQPLTQTALESIQKKVAAAGLTMNEAIRICCERGWAGYDATWATPPLHQGKSAKFDPVAHVNKKRKPENEPIDITA